MIMIPTPTTTAAAITFLIYSEKNAGVVAAVAAAVTLTAVICLWRVLWEVH